MGNTVQKFRRSSIVFEKPAILSENLKTLTNPNYPEVQYFSWNFAHVFYLPLFFRFIYSELFAKITEGLASSHSFFTLLLITQDLNKMKKSHTFFYRDY